MRIEVNSTNDRVSSDGLYQGTVELRIPLSASTFSRLEIVIAEHLVEINGRFETRVSVQHHVMGKRADIMLDARIPDNDETESEAWRS